MPGVVVLGGGSTGEHFCGALRRLDADVPIILVESNLVGGECTYFACMPSKTLLRAPELREAASRTPGVTGGPLDVQALFGWRDWVTDDWDDAAQAKWLDGLKVELVRGVGRVARPGVVEAGGRELEYDRLVVATGSSPVSPPVEGLESVDSWTTADATSSHEVPASLIVMGGGVSGCELAQLYRRLGSGVTMVDRGGRLMPRVDAEAATVLQAAFEDEGIVLRFDAEVERVEPAVQVTLAGGETLEAERLLVAVGRKPNMNDLGLEQLGVQISKRGIEVDEQLRAAENVWALGDCNGKGAFTHTAYNDYEIVAANLLDKDTRRVSDRIPAYNLYTDPPLGRVGMTEAEVRKSGKKALIATRAMANVSRAVEKGETQGFMKILVDAETKQILGASILGVGGDEVIHSILTLMSAKAPYTVMQRAMFIHPTVSELLPTMLGTLRPLQD